jgi:hypothetical protein
MAVARVFLEPAGDLVDAEPTGADFEALLRLGLGCGEGGEQSLPQHPELHVVEQGMHSLTVPGLAGEVGDLDVQRHVTNQFRELAVTHHRGEILAKRVAHLALDRVHAGHECVERPEVAHPLGRRFLAHSRNAGQVVTRVAAQCREIGVLGRRQAVLLGDLTWGEAGQLADPLARVENGDLAADQLQGVPIAGADEHLDALARRLGGEGGDHVVGLVALDGQRRNAQRLEHFLDERELTPEVRGRLAATGLVFRVRFGAESLPRDVERDRQVSGVLIPEQVDQHGGEAVDGVCRLARRGGEVLHRKRVEGAIGKRMAVQQEKTRGRIDGRHGG